MRRRGYPASTRWNHFEHARVLGGKGAFGEARCQPVHQEESVMNIAVAHDSFDKAPRTRFAPSGNDASFGAEDKPLTRAQIDGRFSLVDRGPLAIAAERGAIVCARSGSIWVTQPGDRQYWLVRANERFVAGRTGLLVVRGAERAELDIHWPAPALERLSPGLEPIAVVL
jgi:hypothetical protein